MATSDEYKKMVAALKRSGVPHDHAHEIVRMGHKAAFARMHRNSINAVAQTVTARAMAKRRRRKP